MVLTPQPFLVSIVVTLFASSKSLSNTKIVGARRCFRSVAPFAAASDAGGDVVVVDKHEARFDRMVEELRLPPAAVESIDSPKQRVLFRGVAAGVKEPRVLEAFSIVYRDLGPVRVAGDLIFSQLAGVAADAVGRVAEIADDVDERTAYASRRAFDLLDSDGSGTLDRDELLRSPALLALIRNDDNDGDDGDDDDNDEATVERFLEAADANGDGLISFVEFAAAAAATPALRRADEVLSAAVRSAEENDARQQKTTTKRKKKRGAFGLRRSPEDRFDAMLETCLEWEADLGCAPADVAEDPDGCAVDAAMSIVADEDEDDDDADDEDEDGRLMRVLKGSLVGARCEPVVEALRMCYLEYSPLRLGGDIIFELLKRVVANEIAKQQRNRAK